MKATVTVTCSMKIIIDTNLDESTTLGSIKETAREAAKRLVTAGVQHASNHNRGIEVVRDPSAVLKKIYLSEDVSSVQATHVVVE